MRALQSICYLTALCASAAPTQEALAAKFTFDKQHTEVRFSWDHLGISRQSGRVGDVTGTLEFDPEKPEASTISVEIKVASLSTGIPALDTQLTKTKDYFNVAEAALITFKSREVHVTGEKTADVTGDLTINGITKPATLAVHANFLGPHPLGSSNVLYKDMTVAGFSARTQILRSDWEISRMVPLVSDEIRIAIEAELHSSP